MKAGGENALMEAQREMQQDGNDFARGSGEKLLQGNLVHTHAMRTLRGADGFDNTMSRVSDVSNAQLTQSVIDQTVRSVLLSVRDGSSELRVRLKPEHLGELHLRVVVKDNVLHLDVSTQSTVVKSVLESNLGQLRQSLDNSGLDTGKLSVTVDPDLSSGGESNRQAHGFQPFENDWTPYRAGDEMPSDAVSQIARMRYAVGRLDLIA
jgi:flagellar hook-length control protein FliK